MAQLFGPTADRRLRRAVLALALLVAAGLLGLFAYERSDARWSIGKPEPQPIAFQHNLHVTALGIGCRYCHVTASRAAAAGMPSVASCLTCHSQVWRGTPQLQPLHEAARAGAPIRWRSVSRLPAHSRFHHGAHAAADLPCATCHGAVETMAETTKTESFSMGWCVDCHRAPAAHQVPVAAAARAGRRDLTDCAVCHH